MAKKQLRTKDVDSKFCLTAREITPFLATFDPSTPIMLKCGGKNFRLGGISTVAGKPVLVGRRGKKD